MWRTNLIILFNELDPYLWGSITFEPSPILKNYCFVVFIFYTLSPECGSDFNEVPAYDSTSKWARNPNLETKQTQKLEEILYFQM